MILAVNLHGLIHRRASGAPRGAARDRTQAADAASTALFVAGPEAWLEVARRLGIVAALRVDAAGAIEMTGEMRDRFAPGTSGASAIIAVVD